MGDRPPGRAPPYRHGRGVNGPAVVAGLDLQALQRFFDANVPGAGEISAELLHGGRSNLTCRITDGTTSWVLRRPPLGLLTPSAHDMGREYRVVAALRDSAVPVARAVAPAEDLSVLPVPFLCRGARGRHDDSHP